MKQIIGDMAARNGERGLMAAWENNAHIVSRSALKLIAALPLYVGGWMRRSVARLRQEGHDEIADDLAQYHTEQLAAAKQAQAPAWAAKFWAQEDLRIQPPTYKGKAAINFKAPRETMLAAVKAAPSEDHLGRFERDNDGNLQRIEVALKPAKQDVIAAIAARRGELRARAAA